MFSTNTVFCQVSVTVGGDRIREVAQRMGIRSPLGDFPSIVLGAYAVSPLEMASAYGTFANGGIRVAPTGILRVLDRDGTVLLDNAKVTARDLRLSSGPDRIEINGTVADRLDLGFSIDAPDLAALYPGLTGQLSGAGRLGGTLQAPQLVAELRDRGAEPEVAAKTGLKIDSYFSAPKSKKDGPKSLDEVDPKLLETYDKLGIPLHERAALAGVAVAIGMMNRPRS